jgi:hypothetical protein
VAYAPLKCMGGISGDDDAGTTAASFKGVPSTGQKLNLSANSSRQVEHCFIFILTAASSQAEGFS